MASSSNNIEYWSGEFEREVTELEGIVFALESEAESSPEGSDALTKLFADVRTTVYTACVT